MKNRVITDKYVRNICTGRKDIADKAKMLLGRICLHKSYEEFSARVAVKCVPSDHESNGHRTGRVQRVEAVRLIYPT